MSNFSLALEEARRAAEHPDAAIVRVRDRCTLVLARGAAAAAFLGGLAVNDNNHWGPWAWAALVAYVVAVATAVWVIWPRRLSVPPFPHQLIQWAESGASSADMERDLALYLELDYEEATPTISRMIQAYCCTIILVAAMIAALLMNLRSW